MLGFASKMKPLILKELLDRVLQDIEKRHRARSARTLECFGFKYETEGRSADDREDEQFEQNYRDKQDTKNKE